MLQDNEGDMYDALYREYHNIQGRWISPDRAGLAAVAPANPQSLNRYAYVMNNPTGLIDPLGLCEGVNGPCHPVYDPASWDPFGDAGWTSLTLVDMALTATLGIVPLVPDAGLYNTQLFVGDYGPPIIWVYGNLSILDLEFLMAPGTGGPGPSGPGNAPGQPTSRRVCAGPTRALAGNPALVNGPNPGAFGVVPTANCAAVIPVQWGRMGSGLAPYREQIMGFVVVPSLGGILGFTGVSDTIGNSQVKNVQGYLQDVYPGALELELNGLPKANDPMVTFGVVSTPGEVGCPVGTSPI
jgi:RHS repeat-associated protein